VSSSPPPPLVAASSTKNIPVDVRMASGNPSLLLSLCTVMTMRAFQLNIHTLSKSCPDQPPRLLLIPKIHSNLFLIPVICNLSFVIAHGSVQMMSHAASTSDGDALIHRLQGGRHHRADDGFLMKQAEGILHDLVPLLPIHH